MCFVSISNMSSVCLREVTYNLKRCKMVAAVLIVLPLLFLACGECAEHPHAVLQRVVEALEKLVGFYKASYTDMNLDGVYGLKVLEGQIQRILNEYSNGQHASLSPTIVGRLQSLLKDAQSIAEQAIAVVRAADENYFQNLAFLITEPWTLLKRHRKVVPTSRWEIPVYQAARHHQLEEKQSDECMMEITQSNHTAAGRGGCSLTRKCALIMTEQGLTQYGITHQILWTALAEKAGCDEELNNLLKDVGFNSTDHMQEEFCTNNFYEMLTMVHVFMYGKVKNSYQDMFMEQQFVCPNLGFYEFLKKDYLDQILSWQLPSGCFGNDPVPLNQSLHKLPQKLDVSKLNFLNNLKSSSKISFLDQKKQQVLQQLKDLKSSNPLVQTILQEESVQDHMKILKQQLQPQNEQWKGKAVKSTGVQLGQNMWQAQLEQDQFLKPASQQVKRFNLPNQLQGNPPLRVQRDTAVHANAPVRPLDNLMTESHNSIIKPFGNAPVMPQGYMPNAVQGKIPINLQPNFHYIALKSGARLQSKTANMLAIGKISSINGVQNSMLNRMPNSNGQIGHNAGVQSISLDNKYQHDTAFAVQQTLKEKAEVALQHRNAAKGQAQVIHVRAEGQHNQHLIPQAARSSNLHFQEAFVSPETGQASMRKPLVEKDMPDGCLAHKTGVACGALVMYLRYLIDPGPLDLFAHHEFYPDSPRGLLGDGESYRKIMNLLGEKMQFDNSFLHQKVDVVGHDRADTGAGNQGEYKDNGDANDSGEYKVKDEMYPEANAGARQEQSKKVVHFGVNAFQNGEHYNHLKEDDYDRREEEEEEGADYIKRVKGEDDNTAASDKGNQEDDYTYYDDSDKSERGIIKRHKPQAPPQNGARIRAHQRHKPHPGIEIDSSASGQADSPPSKMLVLLLSFMSFAFMIVMYRFLRRRRGHFRHSHKGAFKL